MLVVFALICVFNLFETYRSFTLEGRLKAADETERKALLEDADFSNSLRFAQKNGFSLGLDLQGGLFVTMEVGVEDILTKKAGVRVDEEFISAIAASVKEKETSQESLVDIFARQLRAAKAKKLGTTADQVPGNIMAGYFAGEGVNYDATDDVVVAYLKTETETAIQNTYNIIRTRVDQFGVTSPNLQLQPGTGRILLELPGVKDPERVKKLLRGTAKLEFRETVGVAESFPVLERINKLVQRREGIKSDDDKETVETDSTKTDSTAVAANDSAKTDSNASTTGSISDLTGGATPPIASDDSTGDSATTAAGDDKQLTREEFLAKNPFLGRFNFTEGFGQNPNLPLMGYVNQADTAFVNRWLRDPEVQNVIPVTMKFLWEAKDQEGNKQFGLIAIRKSGEDKAPLEGNVIQDARADYDENMRNIVKMEMNSTGAQEWARLTKANVDKCIAIVLDDLVYSYPTVNQVITGGRSEISGNFTIEEAKDLANLLKAGTLPVEARILGDSEVGPTLGASNLRMGLWSFLIAFLAVIVFMLFYYRSSGLVADIALVGNLFFLLGVSAALNIVFTLPGIAAVVLTMGMAVDANVLIFERIREELANGKATKSAIKAGFSNAFSSVMDSNITTFLTGLVLFVFGVGPIRGFAVTLMIGIITSLISALFLSRLLIEFFTDRKPEGFSFGATSVVKFFSRINLRVTQRKKTFYILSSAMVIGSLISIFTLGFKSGVDLQGGRQFKVAFNKEVSPNDVRDKLTATFGNVAPVIKTIGGENQLMITTSYMVNDDKVDDQIKKTLLASLEEAVPGSGAEIKESSRVGPTVANDVRRSAIFSIVFSLIIIFAYIFIRFRGARFSIGALVALAHDVIIVLGLVSLLGSLDILPFLEIDQAMIAAILTIIGYSINDTVVVFDRIRENSQEMKTAKLTDVYDSALNQTLARTTITGLTTLLTVLVMLFMGGDTLKGFMFAMFVGITIGTYSSIFVASPISLDLIPLLNRKKKEAQK